MDFLGMEVTLEEAQELFRSPLNHAPQVVVIEEFEFEEYEVLKYLSSLFCLYFLMTFIATRYSLKYHCGWKIGTITLLT